MDIIIIFLAGVYLFLIIFFAVRLAISPIIPNKEEITITEDDLSIVDLRDFGLFDNNEIDDILKVLQAKGIEKKKNIKFEKYLDILTELKNIGYLDSDELQEKIGHLKRMLDKE